MTPCREFMLNRAANPIAADHSETVAKKSTARRIVLQRIEKKVVKWNEGAINQYHTKETIYFYVDIYVNALHFGHQKFHSRS